MTKKMLIDATHAEETRVVVVDGNKVEEFDFESLNKRQLAGNIYLAKVTRVEPSLQAAFVDYGGNRHGFLAFSEIHPDYYQIPKADREALLAEEAALAREADEDAPREKAKPRRSRSRRRSSAAEATGTAEEAVVVSEPVADLPAPEGMQDVPPPSAAAGDIEFVVPDEPTGTVTEPAEQPEVIDSPVELPAAVPADALVEADEEDAAAEEAAEDGYEAVGGDDVQEERAPRKPMRQRRYKIQEVIKVRQILLVQVVKEERGNKGAALTTYLSLAGRYCVLMPNTARGGGISRKITNATDRKKLKEISSSITVPEGAGLIIRTAGASRTKTEIKRDYEYLLRQWEQVRDLTLRSIAPAPIYEEGSLIKRVIRDLYSREMDEILVDGERGYREAKDYMKMLMPSHAKNVKHYNDPLPLFSRFQVESYLSAMFNPVVQLKSGGYIVIDVTEALVAIDVNSGRATREASIEETALKTNLEAAEEAARQMRLRDLAGLVVIDFIDMEDRRNNAAVEKRLKDKLKSDRARIQVGRISPFGLLEMSRQRLRPGMIEATTKACPHCHGTGRVRSDDSMALALLREIEEEGVKQRSKEVLIVVPVEIANYLEGDPSLISPDYRIERFKTASRIIPVPEALNLGTVSYPEPTEEEVAEEEAEETAAEANGNGEKAAGKRKRRRRRRGGKAGQDGAGDGLGGEAMADDEAAADDETEGEAAEEAPEAVEAAAPADEEAAPAPSRTRSRRRSRSRSGDGSAEQPAASSEQAEPSADSSFGEVIDLGEESVSAIVEVPETGVTQRRPRERVRQPAAAVLAGVGVAVAEPTAVAEVTEAGGEVAEAVAENPVDAPVDAPVEEGSAAEATPVEGAAAEVVTEEAAVDPAPETFVAEAAAEEPAPEPVVQEDAPMPEPAPEETTGQMPDQAPEPMPDPAPEPMAEAETAAPDLETVQPGPGEEKLDEGPKRRGWWSRAVSS